MSRACCIVLIIIVVLIVLLTFMVSVASVTIVLCIFLCLGFLFQAEDGIRDLVRSRGLGDVYKRQGLNYRLH